MNRYSAHLRFRCATAFTLVELLFTIGIIALLISILVPVIRKARESAVRTQCATQLRTIGQAITMYANDYRGRMPYRTATASNTLDAGTRVEPSQLGMLWAGGYLGKDLATAGKVLFCPDTAPCAGASDFIV